MSLLLLVVSALHILILILLFVATLDKSWWTLPGKESLNLWLAEGGAGPHGALPHSLLSLLHPVHVPALHHATRRSLLCHRPLPALHQPGGVYWGLDLCHSRRGDPGEAPARGQLRILLRPGLGGLPPRPGQRHHLHPPTEAGVSAPPRPAAPAPSRPPSPR
ncbi:EMP3 isoform 8, partial [Pongo abelii]